MRGERCATVERDVLCGDREFCVVPDREHRYAVRIVRTGNLGAGTADVRAYARAHEIDRGAKPTIGGSSDPAFRGDPSRWNPEELLLASLSACHQLWYLGLCAEAGVVVTAYEDHADAIMIETDDGGGQFASATLRPRVTIAAASDERTALRLHARADAKCFIARSVNFPVRHDPVVRRAGA